MTFKQRILHITDRHITDRLRKYHFFCCSCVFRNVANFITFKPVGIQYVGQQMRPELADGDFAGAFRTFATLCDDFITQARNGQPYDVDTLPKEPLSLIWIPVAIVIGFIIAFVIVGGMKKQLKTVRFQAKADDYVKAGSMNIVDNQEWFLYQNIVKTEKPKDNDKSSGGSSTHTSSSGSVHGGGGFKF